MDKKLLYRVPEHQAPDDTLPVEYIVRSSLLFLEKQRVLCLSFFKFIKNKGKPDDKNSCFADRASYRVFLWPGDYATLRFQDNGQYKWIKASVGRLFDYYPYWRSWPIRFGFLLSEDRHNVEVFFGTVFKDAEAALEAVRKHQSDIMKKRLDVKNQKIKDKIDQVMNLVPGLPEDFESWIYEKPFGFSRYVYYIRRGRKILAYCTACKNDLIITDTAETKKQLKHNLSGVCPKCGQKVVFKAEGITHNLRDDVKFSIIQKCGGDLVMRYFTGHLYYMSHYRKPELSFFEDIRETYSIKDGKLDVTKYEFGNFRQTGEHRWCNDFDKFYSPKAYLYTANLKELLQDTAWKYSCLYEFAEAVKTLHADSFLREYIKRPAIEYFVKLGLFRFLNEHLDYKPSWTNVNFEGKNIKDVLGLEKPVLVQVQRLDLGRDGIQLIKTAAMQNIVISDHDVLWVVRNADVYNFIQLLTYATPHKIIKYVMGQIAKDYTAENIIQDWLDYINQCKRLKFDLTNTFVFYPKNLRDKHEEYTILLEARGLEKYEAKVRKAYELIDAAYSYKNKKYIVSPAGSVDEIVREGHRLRHCVAGVYYVSGVADGKRAIMFVRKVDEPDIPFYTLELILSDLSVSQCRGFKNCNMTDDVKKFIEVWKQKKLTIDKKRKIS